MSLSLVLNLIELVARVLVTLDNYRVKLEGKAEANKEATDVQVARIKAALAATYTPPGGVPDPNDRDAVH